MKPIAAVAVAVVALGAAACGTSEEDKAKEQVCDARADISKQVDTLEGLTLSTATTSQVKDSLTAIRDDLRKIGDAQGDLDDERKSQVQAANAAFAAQLQSIAADLGRDLSAADAKAQLQSALRQLATTYRQTFAKVDCGS
jgi:hypothetical protein